MYVLLITEYSNIYREKTEYLSSSLSNISLGCIFILYLLPTAPSSIANILNNFTTFSCIASLLSSIATLLTGCDVIQGVLAVRNLSVKSL